MLVALQSQTFGFRSNHGNHPEFVSLSLGTNNIGNARDFPQVLQALDSTSSVPADDRAKDICQQPRRCRTRLQGEFSAHARLDPYLWEHEPMLANAGDYQENIPAPGDFDIFFCLLWSRLGSRLGSKHRTRDGQTFPSGSMYEFENALQGARQSASAEHPRGRPDMLVFVKKAPLVIESEPKEVRDERYRQFDALQHFIRFAFRDQADGTFAIASNSFTELGPFEELLEKGLRRSILDRIPFGEVDATLPPATYIPLGRLSLVSGISIRSTLRFSLGALERSMPSLPNCDSRRSPAPLFAWYLAGAGWAKARSCGLACCRLSCVPPHRRHRALAARGVPAKGWGEAKARPFPRARPSPAAERTLVRRASGEPRGIRVLLTALDRVAVAAQRELGLASLPAARFALLIDQMEELLPSSGSINRHARPSYKSLPRSPETASCMSSARPKTAAAVLDQRLSWTIPV